MPTDEVPVNQNLLFNCDFSSSLIRFEQPSCQCTNFRNKGTENEKGYFRLVQWRRTHTRAEALATSQFRRWANEFRISMFLHRVNLWNQILRGYPPYLKHPRFTVEKNQPTYCPYCPGSVTFFNMRKTFLTLFKHTYFTVVCHQYQIFAVVSQRYEYLQWSAITKLFVCSRQP